MEDEYELMPAVELEKLRQEVAALKAGPTMGGADTAGLQQSMNNLTSAINRLLKVFSGIDEELLTNTSPSQNNDALSEQLAEIKDQNEQIAEGIVTVADMLKNDTSSMSQSVQEPVPVETQETVPAQAVAPSPVPENSFTQAPSAPQAEPAAAQQQAVAQDPSQSTPQMGLDQSQPMSEPSWNLPPSQPMPQDPFAPNAAPAMPDNQPAENQPMPTGFPPLSEVNPEPLPNAPDQSQMASQLPQDPFNAQQGAPGNTAPQIQNMPPPPEKKGIFGLFNK